MGQYNNVGLKKPKEVNILNLRDPIDEKDLVFLTDWAQEKKLLALNYTENELKQLIRWVKRTLGVHLVRIRKNVYKIEERRANGAFNRWKTRQSAIDASKSERAYALNAVNNAIRKFKLAIADYNSNHEGTPLTTPLDSVLRTRIRAYRELLDLVNEYRVDYGLPALEADSRTRSFFAPTEVPQPEAAPAAAKKARGRRPKTQTENPTQRF